MTENTKVTFKHRGKTRKVIIRPVCTTKVVVYFGKQVCNAPSPQDTEPLVINRMELSGSATMTETDGQWDLQLPLGDSRPLKTRFNLSYSLWVSRAKRISDSWTSLDRVVLSDSAFQQLRELLQEAVTLYAPRSKKLMLQAERRNLRAKQENLRGELRELNEKIADLKQRDNELYERILQLDAEICK